MLLGEAQAPGLPTGKVEEERETLEFERRFRCLMFAVNCTKHEGDVAVILANAGYIETFIRLGTAPAKSAEVVKIVKSVSTVEQGPYAP